MPLTNVLVQLPPAPEGYAHLPTPTAREWKTGEFYFNFPGGKATHAKTDAPANHCGWIIIPLSPPEPERKRVWVIEAPSLQQGFVFCAERTTDAFPIDIILIDGKRQQDVPQAVREKMAAMEIRLAVAEKYAGLQRDTIAGLEKRLEAAEAERDKLAMFKTNTHILLTEAGVPQFANEDCRVSFRIRWLAEELRQAEMIATSAQRDIVSLNRQLASRKPL